MSIEKRRIAIRSKDKHETSFIIERKDDPQSGESLSKTYRSQVSAVGLVFHGDRIAHKRNLVLKRYEDYPVSLENRAIGIENRRDRAITLYNILKSIGVKHIPATFRAVGEQEILMTDFNKGGHVTLSRNIPKSGEPREEQIESLTNFNEAIKELGKDFFIAALHNIYIIPDALFLVVPDRGAKVNCRIEIADLEEMASLNNGHFTPRRLVDAKTVELQYRRSVESLKDFFSRHIISHRVFLSDSACRKLGDLAKGILLPDNLAEDIRRRLNTT